MRKIEFRAKRISDGKWVYGDLECRRLDGRCFIHSYAEDGMYHTQFEVNPETVGQLTGVADKNGHYIYEGDILHYEGRRSDNIGVHYRRPVIWHDGAFRMQLEDGKPGACITESNCINWDICGNVHDDINAKPTES